MSPALCLGHEMGHAALHLDGKVIPSKLQDINYELQNETINLWYYENPIAMELGEPIRMSYYDGLYKTPVRNSTYHSKPAPYPWWYILIYRIL